MMSRFDFVEIYIKPLINWSKGAIEWTAAMRTMVVDEYDEEAYTSYYLHALSDDDEAWSSRYGWIASGETLKPPARFGSSEAAATFARNAFDNLVALYRQWDETETQCIRPLG